MMTLKMKDDVETHRAVNKSRFLDYWNHKVVNSFVWGCSTDKLTSYFDGLVSENHLDIGVRCGYVLQALLQDSIVRLVIADEDPGNLLASAQRLSYYQPEKLHANDIGKWPANLAKFDSVSVNYLLHRIMGRMDYKGERLFKNVAQLLNPGGDIFGSTILGLGVDKSFICKHVMRFCNDRLIFNNRLDSPSLLRTCLEKHFENVEIEIVGSVALFRAKKPI